MRFLEVIPGNGVELKIENFEVAALLDTGSDTTAVGEDICREYFSLINLKEDIISLHGSDVNIVTTLVSFSRNVFFSMMIYLVLNFTLLQQMLNFKLIVGNNLLTYAEVPIKSSGISVFKKKSSFK